MAGIDYNLHKNTDFLVNFFLFQLDENCLICTFNIKTRRTENRHDRLV